VSGIVGTGMKSLSRRRQIPKLPAEFTLSAPHDLSYDNKWSLLSDVLMSLLLKGISLFNSTDASLWLAKTQITAQTVTAKKFPENRTFYLTNAETMVYC
jgi:hypothetical protein